MLKIDREMYNRKTMIRLHIDGVGDLICRRRIRGKYIDIILPKKFNRYVDESKIYTVYLKETRDITDILERKVIVHAGGRKYRIEIPRWYLEERNITDESIIEIIIEYNGIRRKLYTRYNGVGPLIQSLWYYGKGLDKVYVVGLRKYLLKYFIDDFNSHLGNYDNISLKLSDNRLYLNVDSYDYRVGKYIFSTYSYYVYLLLGINGRNEFKTIRINNYGDQIKIYYIQPIKRCSLFEKGTFLPVIRISSGAGILLISYYDPRKKRVSVTYLVTSRGKIDQPRYINNIVSETILSEVHKVIVRLSNDRWAKEIVSLIHKRRLYYRGDRKTNYHYELGSIGESIFYEYLRDKGYKIMKRNFRSSEHGADIRAKRGEGIWIVEVKTTTSDNNGFYKLNEALKQARDRVKESSSTYSKIIGVIGCAVILNTTEPICSILYKKLYL